MSLYHACVWLDQHEARIFAISAEKADETLVHDDHAPQHRHRHADHHGHGHADHALYDAVAKDLAGYKAILIAGPGQARTALSHHLKSHYPQLSEKVWGNEAMDHPTDRQIVAAARKFFHAEDRMHS